MKLKRHINFLNESWDLEKDGIQRHEGNEELFKSPDGTYGSYGDVELRNTDVKDGKILYNFDKSFNFTLKINDVGITTLEGLPRDFAYEIQCHNNDLTDLKGSPGRIERSFDCSSNKLTTLEGAPVHCIEFYCQFNEHLTDLKGAPKQISDFFDASFCSNLTSLEGLPKGHYKLDLIGCSNLTSLETCPEKVGTINIKSTGITSLIDLVNVSFDDIEWQGSKVAKIERDYFINEVSNFIHKKEEYYPEFIKYIKKYLDTYDDPKSYSGVIFPPEVYDTLDDDMKNLFKSSKAVSKYDL